MAERKVFNKYIPPDFDPRDLPKGERPVFNQIKVRSMLPMTICCTQCGEYMGRGTKFNARQEEALGMEWMGLKRWRFYLKCSSCSQEMTFLTDPENDHYVTEHGCNRNLEPWRVKQEVDKVLSEKQKQIESDSMKHLENKSSIIKNQLDLMDTITDLQDQNKINAFMDHDKVIATLSKKRVLSVVDDEQQKMDEFRESKKRRLVQNKVLPFEPAHGKKAAFDFRPMAPSSNTNNTSIGSSQDTVMEAVPTVIVKKKKKKKSGKEKKKKKVINL